MRNTASARGAPGVGQSSCPLWNGARRSGHARLDLRALACSSVTVISTATGAVAGGTIVTITGSGLTGCALKEGWSAPVTSGLAITFRNGATASLGGELSDLGAGYDIWSADAKVMWPF
jgi:hypothetical protein